MAVVFDYSYARPDIATMKAVGIVGVSRYICFPTSTNSAKIIRRPEYEALLRAGLTVTLNWEQSASSWLAGYSEGYRFGVESLVQSRQLGHPDHLPIVLSFDTNVSASQMPLAITHMRGFVEGRNKGPQAVYGGTDIIEACQNAGLSQFGWKAAATSWSHVPSNNVALIQRTTKSYPQFAPGAYDENTVIKPFYGQNPSPLFPPPPPPLKEDEVMAFISNRPAGGMIVVAADLTSWFFVTSNDVTQLVGAGYKQANLDQATIDRIPYANAKVDALTAAVLHGFDSVDFTLTPEQVQAIADSVTVGPEALADIAKAVADEDNRRSAS